MAGGAGFISGRFSGLFDLVLVLAVSPNWGGQCHCLLGLLTRDTKGVREVGKRCVQGPLAFSGGVHLGADSSSSSARSVSRLMIGNPTESTLRRSLVLPLCSLTPGPRLVLEATEEERFF